MFPDPVTVKQTLASVLAAVSVIVSWVLAVEVSEGAAVSVGVFAGGVVFTVALGIVRDYLKLRDDRTRTMSDGAHMKGDLDELKQQMSEGFSHMEDHFDRRFDDHETRLRVLESSTTSVRVDVTEQ